MRERYKEKGTVGEMCIRDRLSSFNHIIYKTFLKEKISDYEAIPENKNFHHDLIIRNATVNAFGNPYIIDIGIARNEVNSINLKGYTYKSVISDVGDLSTFTGLEEIDADGAVITDTKDSLILPRVTLPANFVLKQKNGSKIIINNGFKQ